MTNKITFDIHYRSLFAEGATFGDTGAYEHIGGRVHFTIDPLAPAQAAVTDIALAPRDDNGMVHCAADFEILRPVDGARGNGRVLYDYGNRGNKRALQFFNDAPKNNFPRSVEDAGNGFLMRRGYHIFWMAWQGDLLPGDGRMLFDIPVATDGDTPLTANVRTELIAGGPGVTVFPLSSLVTTRSNPAVSLDTRRARLSRRRYAWSPREDISPDRWFFARVERGTGVDNQGMETTIVPSDSHVYLPEGFETGWIYEIVYMARDPQVLGLGHVAVRDAISFLKYADTDANGVPNPLKDNNGRVDYAYGWGRSQTGRCIRDALYLGFNADAEGRRVFDGVLPHVAGAGKMWMNHRFANLALLPGQEFENHFSPADRFPFSYAVSTDHLSGVTDGILKRPETDPKVIHSDTAAEYWHRRASLVHTDTEGNDLEQPEGVRIYHWASTQHFAAPRVEKPSFGMSQTYFNVAASSMLFRASLDNLDAWVADGTEPPDSRIPVKHDQTLVSFENWWSIFPKIPGVALPRGPSRMERMDFGPDIDKGIIAIDPPDLPGGEYCVQVPATDADGNDIAGIRVPMVQAPLGTYTGWSVRNATFGLGALEGITGSYIPLPTREDERAQTGDPRTSIIERYGDDKGYAAAIGEAARRLVGERLLLEEDVERAIAEAADWGRPRHDVKL